jgi:hypothetical protein
MGGAIWVKTDTFAFHDARDLGTIELAQIAQEFGYTLDELRRLI